MSVLYSYGYGTYSPYYYSSFNYYSYSYMYSGYNYYGFDYRPVHTMTTSGTIAAIIVPIALFLCIAISIFMWFCCCSVVVFTNGRATRVCKCCKDRSQPVEPNFNQTDPPANYNLGAPNVVELNHQSIYSPGI